MLADKLIRDSACVPMTESSFAEDASEDEEVDVDADCAWPGF